MREHQHRGAGVAVLEFDSDSSEEEEDEKTAEGPEDDEEMLDVSVCVGAVCCMTAAA